MSTRNNFVTDLKVATSYFWNVKLMKKNKNLFKLNSEKFAVKLQAVLSNYLQQINTILVENKQPIFALDKTNEIVQILKATNAAYSRIVNDANTQNYSFQVKLNPDYATNYFVSDLNLFFSIDQNAHLMNGGVSLNFNTNWYDKLNVQLNSFEKVLSSIYLNNLFQTFFDELMDNFALRDWANLTKFQSLRSLHSLYFFINSVYNYEELNQKWLVYSYNKFFYRFFISEKQYANLASRILTFYVALYLVLYGLAEWTKQVFNNLNMTGVDKVNLNKKTPLQNLTFFLNKTLIKPIKKKNYLSVVFNLPDNNLFFSHGFMYYQFNQSLKNDLGLSINTLQYLLLRPEEFEFDDSNCFFDNFDGFVKNVLFTQNKAIALSAEILESYLIFSNVDAEFYARNNHGFLMFSDLPNQDDVNVNLIDSSFLMVNVLSKELRYHLLHEQWHLCTQAKNIRNKFLFHKLEQEIDDLQTTPAYTDNTISLKQQYVKMEKKFHVTSKIRTLGEEVEAKIEFDKRQRFIEIIIVGFIVASLISVIDYSNMVWTTIAVSSSGYGAPLWGANPNPNPNSIWNKEPPRFGNRMVPPILSELSIAVDCFIVLINTTVLVVSLIYLIYARKKNKLIEERKVLNI